MKFLRVATVVALALVTGCTSIPIGPQNATVVTAKNFERGKGVTGISDSFTFEGSIYVLTTLTWDTHTSVGTKMFEVRWFNGEKLKSKQAHSVALDRTPWYVYFSTTGIALGAGDCRAEVFADNVLLGTRNFRVQEK